MNLKRVPVNWKFDRKQARAKFKYQPIFKRSETYIEEGDTLHSFLTDFSTVTRDQAVQFLELAKPARRVR